LCLLLNISLQQWIENKTISINIETILQCIAIEILLLFGIGTLLEQSAPIPCHSTGIGIIHSQWPGWAWSKNNSQSYYAG